LPLHDLQEALGRRRDGQPARAFQWNPNPRGEDLLQTYRPAEGTAKTFCLACGSNLFGGGWPDSEHCSVRVTTLDDPVDARPGSHLYVRSLAPWEQLPDDGAKRFETT